MNGSSTGSTVGNVYAVSETHQAFLIFKLFDSIDQSDWYDHIVSAYTWHGTCSYHLRITQLATHYFAGVVVGVEDVVTHCSPAAMT